MPNNAGLQMPQISLARALNQSDFFIENKLFVPKNKTVLYSRNLVFFYVNRRHQGMNLVNLSMKFNYSNVPYQLLNVNQTTVNDLAVEFALDLPIGNDNFSLRSVVTVYRPPLADNVSVGSCAAVLRYDGPGVMSDIFCYNPLLANYAVERADGSFRSNEPITSLNLQANNANEVGFTELASKYGTIFMYTL